MELDTRESQKSGKAVLMSKGKIVEVFFIGLMIFFSVISTAFDDNMFIIDFGKFSELS